MLAEVAIVPSAPLLVPELAGPSAGDTVDVRAAVVGAGESLARTATTWFAVGADGPARRFAAFGADVPVRLTPGGADVSLPVSLLIAAWLRGAAAPGATLVPVPVDPAATPETAAAAGRDLADRLARTDGPVGLLVVADGATALAPGSPGGEDRPSAHRLQERIDAALASADTAALASLDPATCTAEGVAGRAALQVLAAAAGAETARPVVRYAGAPFGVGYTVATWRVAG